ncbi:unnamed protein product, partial [marine sediment metagenome]
RFFPFDNPDGEANWDTLALRRRLKASLVDTLAERTGMNPTVVNEFIGSWATSSTDNNANSLAMQMAAADLFGVEPTPYIVEAWDKRESEWPMHARADRGYATTLLNAIYESTQEWFKERGITSVYLTRGMKFSEEDTELVGPLP